MKQKEICIKPLGFRQWFMRCRRVILFSAALLLWATFVITLFVLNPSVGYTWAKQFKGHLSGLTIDPETNITYTMERQDKHYAISAIDSEGDQIWQQVQSFGVKQPPVYSSWHWDSMNSEVLRILENGTICAKIYPGKFIAYSKAGELLWEFNLANHRVDGSHGEMPMQEAAVISFMDDCVFGISVDGKLAWILDGFEDVWSATDCLFSSAEFYFYYYQRNEGSYLGAVDPKGEMKWEPFRFGVDTGTVVPRANGSIFSCTFEKAVSCGSTIFSMKSTDESGNVNWEIQDVGLISPVRTSNGMAIVRDYTSSYTPNSSNILAIDQSGVAYWKIQLPGRVRSIAIDDTDNIYFLTRKEKGISPYYATVTQYLSNWIPFIHPGQPDRDVSILAFDAKGEQLWEKPLGIRTSYYPELYSVGREIYLYDEQTLFRLAL